MNQISQVVFAVAAAVQSLLIPWCLAMLARNNAVYRWRVTLIDWVFSQEDWLASKKFLDRPGYDELVMKFWRPIRSFYPLDVLRAVDAFHDASVSAHNGSGSHETTPDEP